MSLTAKQHGGEMEPIPERVYVAVCCGVIDLGTQTNKVFNKEEHKVLMQWEVPDVRRVFERDGQRIDLPRIISKRYTLSLSPKANLRKDLESWRGKKFSDVDLDGFDLRKVLGAPCQLQVVHEVGRQDGNVYAAITGLMALPRGTPAPKPETPLSWFSFEEVEGIPELSADIPEWVQKIIMESVEYMSAGQTRPDVGDGPPPDQARASTDDDNLPF